MGTPSRMATPMHGDSVKPPRNPMMQMVQGFADGGLIGGAVDAIKNRQNTLAAIDASSAPAPAPQAAPAKPSMGSEADNYAAQAASIEAEQQAAAKTRIAAAKPKSFLSKLGFSEGGKIEGKGTPTSDSINAEIADTGEPIQVSNKERILSAAQDEFLQKLSRDLGFPSLEAMLEAGTGRPVGPTVKEGKPAAEYGASEMDLKNVLNTPIGNQSRPAAPPMNPSMTSVVTGVNRNGNSFSQDMSAAQPVTPTPVAPAVQVPAPTPVPAAPVAVVTPAAKPNNPMEGGAFVNAVGGGIDTIKGAAQYGLGALTVPFTNATDGIKNATAHMMGAKRPNPSADTEAALEFMKGGVDDLNAAGKEFAIAKNPLIKAAGWTPITPEPAPEQPTPATQATPAAKPAPAKVAAPAAAVQATAKPEAQAAPAASQVQSSRVGNSFTEKNTVMDSRNPLTTINMAGNNASMANANAIRQSLIDSQAGARDEAGSSGGVIADSGRAETNALMDKWGREDSANAAIQAAIANPKSAQAIASILGATTQNDASRNRDSVELTTKGQANQTVRRGQDVNARTASEGHSVIARGQDISAQTAANQLAGNPMDNLVKQTSVDINQHALKKSQQQDKMVEDIGLEQDPARRRALMDTLLASQGKNPAEHRYLKVEGGEEMAQDGFTKIKRPSGVYDTISGKFIPMDGTAPAAAQAPAADKRVVGQTYPTPKGPMIWRGNGWEAAKK